MPSTNANAATLGYDGAGHLTSVSGSLNDAEHPQVLFQATSYSAVGLTGANYALPGVSGTAAFSQALTYGKRLRLTGETDTPTTSTTNLPYSYTVGYDGVGNATSQTDSLMGTWGYTYDALNRLLTATASAGTYAGLTLTESYDAYGNRENQVPSGTYGGPVPSASLLTFTGVHNCMQAGQNNNTVDQWSYDCAGDVLNDGTNMYEYDAEGRQTGTYNTLTGLTGYVYNAEGNRVMKVVVNGFGTPHPTTTVTKEYLLGPNGEQISVLDGSGTWQWTNVYAGGRQLATYDSAGTHFTLTDWLGTKRMQLGVTAASTVTVGEQCTSLPYGDGLNCTGSDVNHLYFTGKQRDTESGNDYFLARYFSSDSGRFLTPDWSKNPQGVPYADYNNPQSLNLYQYVGNNPLSTVDKDGHDPNDVYKLLSAGTVLCPECLVPIGVAAAAVVVYQNRDAIIQTAQSLGNAISNVFNSSDAKPAAPVQTSPEIHPSEVKGKTPTEIDKTATGKGLIPKGPDPKAGKGSYVDPVTGEQRVLVHPDDGHAHVNNPTGQRLGPDGSVVPKKSPEAHIPIKKDIQ